MDHMIINSKFMRGLIAKVTKRMVKKKLGYEIDITLNNLAITYEEGKAHIHTSVDLDVDKEVIESIVMGEDI